MKDYGRLSVELHERLGGKLETKSLVPLATRDDLSIAYTPGVAEVCNEIARDPLRVYDLTIKKNTVAVVSDGSAILGLGNLGPEAALPVMEGKCVLFKEFAGVDAFPICLATQETEGIVNAVRAIAPSFGGINLEDIAAPRCFEVEEQLQDLGIPVFHDDQHGTAIVFVAALINALKVTGKNLADCRVAFNGSGASAIACARLLLRCGELGILPKLGDFVMCDSKGILHKDRKDLNDHKRELANKGNFEGRKGGLKEALLMADVFVGLSTGNLVTQDMIRLMRKDPICFPMANPTPEIMPDLAIAAGAAVVGTGRSDFPNQINNVLAFPGIFRGALDGRADRINDEMKVAAALALAHTVQNPTPQKILPDPLEKGIAAKVAQAVGGAAEHSRVSRPPSMKPPPVAPIEASLQTQSPVGASSAR